MRRSIFALLVALVTAGPVVAETPRDLRGPANRAVREVVMPAYERLATSAATHAAAWERACASRDPGALAGLAVGWRDVADAWATIEFVRVGPVADDFRAERIEFWPDKRNAGARALAALLADPTPPTPATVAAASVATRGLPALERLLFDPGAARRLGLADRDGTRACALGRLIAADLATTTRAVADEWAPLADRIAADESLAREIAARLTTDALTEFQTLIDGKLAPALGKTPDAARPEALQGRRSGRERESFARPLAGLAALVPRLTADAEGTATLVATIDTARAIAEGLPADLGAGLADPKRRMRAVLLRDALRSAQDVAITDFPALVGVSVGFNGRDGD